MAAGSSKKQGMAAATEARLRVVEVVGAESGIASAYAGWLLARMGADVTRVLLPQNPADRATPVGLALQSLAIGKRIVLEPVDLDGLEQLLAEQDVVLADGPVALEQLEISPEEWVKRCPRLIFGVASVFGLTGPHAALPATALDAQAISAAAWSMGEPGRAPLTLPPGIIEHQAGAALTAASLIALEARDRQGTGRVVDVALADVLASYVAGNCRFYIHHGLEWQRSGRRASGSGGAYPFANLPCKDGEVCVCGRTREEWQRLVRAMGNPAWAQEPRYQQLRAMGTEYADEVDELVSPWFAAHTKAELEAIALEHHLILAPIRELQASLQTPQFRERGFFVSERVANRPMYVPSLPYQVRRTRAPEAAHEASRLLIAGVDGVDRRWAAGPRDAAAPLDGVRVVDFGWVWSAPWVSTMLAELGAEVIKVEYSKRPDNLRLAGRVIKNGEEVDGPSREMSPMFHQVNHGKLGVTLNLKEPRAAELARMLVNRSDLVVENMSPGSMDRAGLGYAELVATNPKLVMLAMSVAGQRGALSTMRAYAPTMSSFIGLEGLIGYAGEAPIGALNFALSDPSASVHALVAALAALRKARRTGEGCYIDFSQTEALLGTLRPYLLDAQLHQRQPPTLGNRSKEMAPHGIFPARGKDAWLTLAVRDDEEWAALARVAFEEAWTQDPRFSSAQRRLEHVAALDEAISNWTQRRDRDELVKRLRAERIAASPVLSIEEMWRDPHLAARGIKFRVELPFYGPEDLFRAPWIFSDLEPKISRCGPMTGEHNEFVFGEILGLSRKERAELESAGVIG